MHFRNFKQRHQLCLKSFTVSENGCYCNEMGNHFSPVLSDNCESYTIRTQSGIQATMQCPAGTQFDVKTCTCNFSSKTYCPHHCPSPSKEILV